MSNYRLSFFLILPKSLGYKRCTAQLSCNTTNETLVRKLISRGHFSRMLLGASRVLPFGRQEQATRQLVYCDRKTADVLQLFGVVHRKADLHSRFCKLFRIVRIFVRKFSKILRNFWTQKQQHVHETILSYF